MFLERRFPETFDFNFCLILSIFEEIVTKDKNCIASVMIVNNF